MKHKLILLFFLLLPALGFCQPRSGEVKKVAILEVVDKQKNIDFGIKLLLRGFLAEAVSHTPGYEAYDRNNLDRIMQEEKIQSSGLMDEATIQRLGRKVGASYILVVEAAYMGAEHGSLAVLANMTNVETARITTVQAFGSVNDVDKICNDLTYKLFGIRVVSDNTNSTSPAYNNDSYSYNPRQGQDQTFTVGSVSFKMVYVQGGDFQMGCTYEQGGSCDDDEKHVHQVTLDDYYIGEYEVTQALWREVMGTSVYQQRDKANTSWSMYGVSDDHPMYYVSYNEAQEFCGYLNRKLRDQLQGKRFALPTEAQWEFAARGGNRSKHYKYAGSNDVSAVAYYDGNSSGQTHPAGMKQPNELGLYDMSGNVYEWCSDWYGSSYYSSSPSTNPTGPSSGSNRVLRGGSWYDRAAICRVSHRNSGGPGYRYNYFGFRLVLLP